MEKEEFMKIYDQYVCAALTGLAKEDVLIWGDRCDTTFSTDSSNLSKVVNKIAIETMAQRSMNLRRIVNDDVSFTNFLHQIII